MNETQKPPMSGADLRRTILWVVFGTSLLFLWDKWQIYNGRPSLLLPGKPAVTATTTPAAAPAGVAATSDGSVPAGSPATAGAPAAAAAAAPVARKPVTLETDTLRLLVDPVGGVVVRADLLEQLKTPEWKHAGLMALVNGESPQAGSPVTLFENDAQHVYTAQSGVIRVEGAPNHTTPFTVVDGPKSTDGGATVTLKLAAEGGGLKVTKTFTLHRGRYDIDVAHQIENDGSTAVSPAVYLQLVRDGSSPDGESGSQSRTFTGPALYTDAKKFQKVSFSDLDKDKASYDKKASDGWIAMVQHYFVTAWVPANGEREYYVGKLDSGPAGTACATQSCYRIGMILAGAPVAPGATETVNAKLYAGPQDQGALEGLAPELDRVVDYGWLQPVAKPLFWLLQILHKAVANWGWAIILLTVIVKLAFFPLSAASYKSMAKMKEVGPRLQKIREQYADDKQKQQLAMMELYKTEKINPVGGCLPILVQMPVFIALYWVLLGSVEMRNAPWILWVKDLAAPDSWFILPALMMASMWVQYKLNPTPPDPVQAKVMAIMPIVFGAMMFFFPAGLVLYWTVNNLLSIGQQWAITKKFAQAKPVG
ncbi:MAG TPA: membrane protein insertase YidC [Burkholderiaceae bacterium]|nr:membrane protein insertase YidC [Burkholderiaceae bacterium]